MSVRATTHAAKAAEGIAHIAAVALQEVLSTSRAALVALESRDGVFEVEDLAELLELISERAFMALDQLHNECNLVGIDPLTESQKRRAAGALARWKDSAGQLGVQVGGTA